MRGWFGRSPERQREKAAARVAPGALADYLAAPFPDPATPVDDVEFLALDVETTGLDPARDHVLAVGWVPVIGGRVVLAGADSRVVAAPVDVGDSATIHRITDDEVAAGTPWDDVVDHVLAALTGRVLLAHFARIETGFLSRACDLRWGQSLPVRVVDTLELASRLVTASTHGDPEPGALRLWSARERHGLPAYTAHDPLVDALSCAELFLAQVAEIGRGGPVPLKRVMT